MADEHEYRVVTNGWAESPLRRSNKAAAEGWRYVDTIGYERWGSDSRLVVIVLMERPGEPTS